jgi:hypothetical protein
MRTLLRDARLHVESFGRLCVRVVLDLRLFRTLVSRLFIIPQRTQFVRSTETPLFSAFWSGTNNLPLSIAATLSVSDFLDAEERLLTYGCALPTDTSVHPSGTTALLPTWKELISSGPDDNFSPCLRSVLSFVRTSQ